MISEWKKKEKINDLKSVFNWCNDISSSVYYKTRTIRNLGNSGGSLNF